MVPVRHHRLVLMIYSVRRILVMAVLASSVLVIAVGTDSHAAPAADKLIGTIISESFTGAVIINTKGEQTFYRLYEVLPSGLQIIKVRNDSISLKGADATLYDIYINHDMKAGAAVGTASPSASNDSSPPPSMANPEPVQQPGPPNPRPGRRHVHNPEDD
jgi:hypothetical protein